MSARGRPKVDLLLVGNEAVGWSRALTRYGYKVERARTGEEALETLAVTDVLAVVFELMLDDLEIADLVAGAHEQQPHAALVLVADPVRAGEIVSTLALGVDTFLPLPIDLARLTQHLERQMAGARSRLGALGDDEDGLFVDEAATFEWEEGTSAAEAKGPGTAESDSSLATVSRVAIALDGSSLPQRQKMGSLEGTVKENLPQDPASYDPARFPPEVHDAPTGPTPQLPTLSSDEFGTPPDLELSDAREALSGLLKGAQRPRVSAIVASDEDDPLYAPLSEPPSDALGTGLLDLVGDSDFDEALLDDLHLDDEPKTHTARIRVQVTNPGAALRVGEDGSLEQPLGEVADYVNDAHGFEDDEETRTLTADPDAVRSQREPTRAARPVKTPKSR